MNFQRILVRATNWVGDAVMCIPALQAVRQRFPTAHVSVLARASVAAIYAREPFCDEVILYEAPKGWTGLGQKWKLARQLRERHFDCALLLQNAFESAALVYAAGIPVRIGYDRDARGLLLTEAVQVPEPGDLPPHQRFYYLELLRRAGWMEQLPASSAIRLSSASRAAAAGREHLESLSIKGAVIGVSPGAAYGGAKRWLPERFAEAAATVARNSGAHVLVFGTIQEQLICQQVCDAVEAKGVPCRNFAGRTTLAEYIDMAANCHVYLTNDSGPMHIASALGVPTVVIFGPTDEFATGPTGDAFAIVREPVECSPCLLRECPIDHRCMERVSAGQVANAAMRLLSLQES